MVNIATDEGLCISCDYGFAITGRNFYPSDPDAGFDRVEDVSDATLPSEEDQAEPGEVVSTREAESIKDTVAKMTYGPEKKQMMDDLAEHMANNGCEHVKTGRCSAVFFLLNRLLPKE